MAKNWSKKIGISMINISLIFINCSIGMAAKPFIDCGVFRTTCYQDIATLDPAEAFVWYEMFNVRNCYESLLEYNLKDFSIQPLLAVSWKIDEDGGTFQLRKDVKFHDGTDFNAHAVRFNWQRHMAANKNPATWLKNIKDVKVVDNYTVRIETTKNWAFLLDTLAAHQIFLIASPTAVKKNATPDDPWAFKWFQSNTCGTGPYILKEWVRNQHIQLTRYEGYWRGWSDKHFSGMLFRVVPERSAQLMMIKKGDVDLLNYLPQEFWPGLRADPNLTVKVFSSRAQQNFSMNTARGPCTDKNFRLAVTYAIDYDACRKSLGALEGDMIVGPVMKQDLKKAREFLAKSAYAGKKVELDTPYSTMSPTMNRLAVIVEDNLKQIGITPKLRGTTWQAIAKELFGDPKQKPDMIPLYTASLFYDPYGYLYKMFHTDNIAGGYNLGYSNPNFDALLNKASTTLDAKKRTEIYAEANKILVEDAPSAWVCMIPYVVIHRNNIKVYPYTQMGDALGNILYVYDLYKE